MKSVMTTVAACALLAACGRGADENAPLETRSGARPAPAIVEGCLTAAGDRFVLTQLRNSDESAPTTETYQLVNVDEQLRAHVGRQVRISGEAEAPSVATVQQSQTTAAPAGTAGEARVQTQESTRVEMARMSVTSVTPTGDECAAETSVPDSRP